jgi:hypothetical protein
VAVQNNLWQVNIGQTYGSPVPITSLQVNTQGQLVSGAVLLILIDVNQQQNGPYLAQMNNGSPLTFQNLPSAPISSLQLQFPDGTQSNSYSINIVLCPQANVQPSARILLFFSFTYHYLLLSIANPPVTGQWVAPAPSPTQTISGNGQLPIPQGQYQPLGSSIFVHFSFIQSKKLW